MGSCKCKQREIQKIVKNPALLRKKLVLHGFSPDFFGGKVENPVQNQLFSQNAQDSSLFFEFPAVYIFKNPSRNHKTVKLKL